MGPKKVWNFVRKFGRASFRRHINQELVFSGTIDAIYILYIVPRTVAIFFVNAVLSTFQENLGRM